MRQNIISKNLLDFIKTLYKEKVNVPLHEPLFKGNEKNYLIDTIDTNYVSSVGNYVNEFETKLSEYTNSKYAIATSSGTAALHSILKVLGVSSKTEVLTQAFTFVATCNAIRYCGGHPIFIDIEKRTLGLSPIYLEEFLDKNCEVRDDGYCWNKKTNRKVLICLPMHTYGIPVNIQEIKSICDRYHINLVEDAAESIGSLSDNIHTGNFGVASFISFNGNKIITTGGGGIVITNRKDLADKVRHITTTSRLKMKWHYEHDDVGFNYRMPNINAAIGLAQIEQIDRFISLKRELAHTYHEWGKKNDIEFLIEPNNTRSNYWLNTMLSNSIEERDAILEFTNMNNIMTRPGWKPMHLLKMYNSCQSDELLNTIWAYERVINLPSSIYL